MSESDLSEYERLRLENIRRNNDFLASIGLGGGSQFGTKESHSIASKELSELSTKVKAEKKKRSPNESTTVLQIRYSKRIRNEKEALDSAPSVEETIETEGIDYNEIPIESTDLDDFEFQVFVKLRKWRLLKSRELDVEPYKIFQNRTIAEVIRRRRQDLNWALPKPSLIHEVPVVSTSSSSSSSSSSGEEEIGKITDADVESIDVKISKDLLSCWGIGPSKSKPGSVTYEMIEILNGEECMDLLRASRTATASGDAE